jgi:hypothetical protein
MGNACGSPGNAPVREVSKALLPGNGLEGGGNEVRRTGNAALWTRCIVLEAARD